MLPKMAPPPWQSHLVGDRSSDYLWLFWGPCFSHSDVFFILSLNVCLLALGGAAPTCPGSLLAQVVPP